MKVALMCVLLGALVALGLCYESSESDESSEVVFMNRGQANNFLRESLLRKYHYRRMKSAAESRSELCELHPSCRAYASQHGSELAYHRYIAAKKKRRG